MNKINDADKRIPDICGVVQKKKTDYNAKITEIEGKIPTMPDNIWTGLENFRIFFCALLDSYQQSLISV